jgi:hypothetical protein
MAPAEMADVKPWVVPNPIATQISTKFPDKVVAINVYKILASLNIQASSKNFLTYEIIAFDSFRSVEYCVVKEYI